MDPNSNIMPDSKWRPIAITGIIVLCAEFAIAFAYAGISKHFFLDGPGLINRLGSYYGHDFLPFYAAAKITLSGHAAASYDAARISAEETGIIGGGQIYAPWVYPPSFLFIVLPFGLLPYVWAYITWSASNIMAGIIAGATACRRYWMPAVLILSPLSWLNIFAGQNGGIFASFMIGGLGLIDSHPIVAGILLGMIGLKPQFVLLIPIALVAGRHWTCLLAMSACIGALTIFAYLAFGIAPWLDFGALITKALTAKNEFSAIAPALHIAKETSEADVLWVRSVTIYAMARLVGLTPISATLFQGLSTVLVIAIVIYTWRNQKALELRAAVLAIGTLLATPRAMLYDLPFLLVPVLFGLNRLSRAFHGMADYGFLAALWLFPIAGFFVFEDIKFQFWPVFLWAAMLYCMARYATPVEPPARA